MELTRQIDIYCERMGPEYWAEPVNAVSNIAFLIAAFVMWRRVRGEGLPLATALVVILALIGLASYLWHTHAQVWSVLLDSGFIMVFSLVFIFAANRDFLRLPVWMALAATALYFPYTAAAGWVFGQLPFFAKSAEYWPLPLLMLGYGAYLLGRAPATATGLFSSAALLSVSLTFRWLDDPVCAALPIGTHFMWHVLNGVLLGWMIEVYRRHMIAVRSVAD